MVTCQIHEISMVMTVVAIPLSLSLGQAQTVVITDHRTTRYVGRMCHENDPLDILCLNLNKCPACRQLMYSLFEAPVLGLSVAYLM